MDGHWACEILWQKHAWSSFHKIPWLLPQQVAWNSVGWTTIGWTTIGWCCCWSRDQLAPSPWGIAPWHRSRCWTWPPEAQRLLPWPWGHVPQKAGPCHGDVVQSLPAGKQNFEIHKAPIVFRPLKSFRMPFFGKYCFYDVNTILLCFADMFFLWMGKWLMICLWLWICFLMVLNTTFDFNRFATKVPRI